MGQNLFQNAGILTDGSKVDLGSCVSELANILAKGAAELVAPHGLLLIEYAILRLFLRKEKWTVTQLGKFLPVKTPHISRVVSNLVNKGLVRRRRQRSDRRVVFLTLTANGKALTRELYRSIQAHESRLSQDVSEAEMTAFASVTSKVIASYDLLERSNMS